MMPTAASEVVEQLMRVVTMIVFAYMFMPYGLEYAAGGASMGAGVGAFCAPCLAWYFGYPLPVFLFAAVAAAFVIIRHKDNIKRLLNGTESKIRQGHAEDLKK